MDPKESQTLQSPQPPPPTVIRPSVVLNGKSTVKDSLAFIQNLRFLAIFIVPICAICVPIIFNEPEAKGLAVVLIFIGYLMFDCMPYASVGLVPLIVVPLLQIERGGAFINSYMGDANMLAFSTILLSLSSISSGLTKRLATKLLFLSGGNMRLTCFLTLACSAFFAMWFPDSAVMIFMMDVVQSMKNEMKAAIPHGSLGEDRKSPPASEETVDVDTAIATTKQSKEAEVLDDKSKAGASDTRSLLTTAQVRMLPVHPPISPPLSFYEENEAILELYKMKVIHGVAITISVGSIFWPFGSPAVIMIMNRRTPDTDMGSWLTFSGPLLAMVLPITIAYLDFYIFRLPKRMRRSNNLHKPPPVCYTQCKTTEKLHSQLERLYYKKYRNMGKYTAHELGVVFLLVLSAVLFVSSDPVYSGSWTFPYRKNVKVSSIATLFAVLLFVIPNTGRGLFKGPKHEKDKPVFAGLLGWKFAQTKVAWDLIIFMGGGLALASASFTSKFDAKIASCLKTIKSPRTRLLAMMLLSLFMSTVASNTYAARSMLRVSDILKESHPTTFYLFPSIAVSVFSFSLPCGTPTLALLHMRTRQKIGVGRYLGMGFPLSLTFLLIVYFYSAF